MTTADFIAELQGRGFDAFAQSDLVRYINWGGRYIASKTRTLWENTSWSISLTPGQYSVALSTLTGYKSVDRVIGTTSGFGRKLSVMNEEYFLSRWLPLDLTLATNRAEPTEYIVFNQSLYILAPPVTTRAFTVYGHQQWVNLDVSVLTGIPITPERLDEAIVLAAMVRCHKRAHEPDLAQEAWGDLAEIFDVEADLEEMTMSEEDERTQPDDTWL